MMRICVIRHMARPVMQRKPGHLSSTGRCSVDIKSYSVVYPTVWYLLNLSHSLTDSISWRVHPPMRFCAAYKRTCSETPKKVMSLKGWAEYARLGRQTRLEGKASAAAIWYMHLYLKHRDHIHLLFLLDKDEQEDLTTEQRRNLRLMVAELKRL
jgi:hypothetical protein